MEEAVAHGGIGRLRGVGRDARRRSTVMGDGLSHPPEHQPDAHAGGKQHGKPAGDGELGFLVFVAQFEVAIAAEGQQSGHDHQAEHHPEVQPAEIGGDGCQRLIKECTQGGGGHDSPGHDDQDQSRRQQQ